MKRYVQSKTRNWSGSSSPRVWEDSKVLYQDTVTVELSPYDTRGRIIRRK